MEPSELLPTVDKSQVPPLHQKRMVAFLNHFLISSCGFLNEFATSCESKFIELERKIQRIEAGLTIIEAKLASIPSETVTTAKEHTKLECDKPIDTAGKVTELQVESTAEAKPSTVPPPPPINENVMLACEDLRYKKFFKMVQFGVPPNAVKMKMQSEGIDPNILDTPNLKLPDGTNT